MLVVASDVFSVECSPVTVAPSRMNRDPGKAVHRRIESMREDAAGAVSPVSPRDGDIAAMAGTLGVARRTTCCRF